MKWRVEGASRQTGQDITATVDARDEEAAREFARQKGIIVAAIGPVPEVVDYTPTPTVAPVKIPRYTGLEFASSISLAFSIISYVSAIASLVAVFIMIAKKTGDRETFSLAVQGVFGGVFSGLILQAISAGLAALRDIARNSWK